MRAAFAEMSAGWRVGCRAVFLAWRHTGRMNSGTAQPTRWRRAFVRTRSASYLAVCTISSPAGIDSTCFEPSGTTRHRNRTGTPCKKRATDHAGCSSRAESIDSKSPAALIGRQPAAACKSLPLPKECA
eukprot:365851-Chlamydomonas_euryale.AAC.6